MSDFADADAGHALDRHQSFSYQVRPDQALDWLAPNEHLLRVRVCQSSPTNREPTQDLCVSGRAIVASVGPVEIYRPTMNERQLPSEGSVLVDASTVDLLAGHYVYHALTDTLFSDPNNADLLYRLLRKQFRTGVVAEKEAVDAFCLNHALSFLEQWVLAVEMCVDDCALNSLVTSHNQDKICRLSALFSRIAIPEHVNSQAAENVSAFYRSLDSSSDPDISKIPVHGSIDYDLPLKDAFYAKFSGYLSVSSNSSPRSVFYLQVSNMLGVPLFLHPCKSKHLREIGQTFYESSVASYKQLTSEIRHKLSYDETQVVIPPIADEVIRVALQERVSLIDAARAVRDTKPISTLRLCLSELWKMAIDRGKVAQRGKIIQEAENIARSIESTWGLNDLVSRRRIEFAELPVIGPYLKLIGWSPYLEVPDVVLYQKPYVALFSRWANEVELTRGS